jgi:hypothetical protein
MSVMEITEESGVVQIGQVDGENRRDRWMRHEIFANEARDME